MIVKDESDKELRIFGSTKKNITTPMPSLQFRFESVRVGKKQIEAPKIVWDGENGADVEDEIMRAQDGGKKGKSTARARAGEFLKGVLSGGPRLSAEVDEVAAKAGHSEMTLRRAKKELGIEPYNEPGTMDGPWWVALPGEEVKVTKVPLALKRVQDWLVKELRGGPRLTADMIQAAIAANISDRTMRRAKIGLVDGYQNKEGEWIWQLVPSYK